MNGCQDKECHDKVVRMNFFMKICGASLGILATIVMGFGLYALAADKEDKTKVGTIEKNQAVMQKDIEHIRGDVKDIKEHLKRSITRDDLNRLVEAVQKGK